VSNAKVRHRRRRRHRLATEWWHLVIGGRVVLFPPSHRALQRDPVFLDWARSVVSLGPDEYVIVDTRF
jgi:hypothetical protein